MTTILQTALHDYLVLFAMVNAFGNLPVFWDLTHTLTREQRARTFRVAISTACIIVVGFAFLGDWLLRYAFQVDVNAFKIAGGILVFAVAARGVLVGTRSHRHTRLHYDNMAIFPLAFPFLVGPGTIVTTILIMQSEGSRFTAIIAILVYASILPLLHLSPLIARALGRVGALVLSRILYVFICAKAVAFCLDGLHGSLRFERMSDHINADHPSSTWSDSGTL